MATAKVTSDKIKLSAWMKKNYPALTLSHLMKLCRTGQIRVNGSRAPYSRLMAEGDEIKLPPFIAEYETAPETAAKKQAAYSQEDIDGMLSSIIYEDADIIAINKPAGLAAQGGTGITKHADTLINAARPEFSGNLRIAHRIDKETSGIMIIAKGHDAAAAMTAMFRERKARKKYLALVYGSIPSKEGVIRAPIAEERDENGNDWRRTKDADSAKYALTRYKVADEAFGLISLVELMPATGRTHQLRIHMKHIGHPIVGDFKYGREGEFTKLKRSLDIEIARSLHLHAAEIEIEGKPAIRAPMPPHMRSLCKYLGF
ncbi:MAG: RluA family pseudouridine synthase [Rickettsiales bacterium]|jgi:23S rRNA pseudouridine955/2504/2580 synthase|nr:RluA family pseudouridine synthase [Rickettsiales bacterium]